MATSYTVAPGHEFNYPSETDDKIIKNAGGRSKMHPDVLARIKFKTVIEGQDCSDMPTEVFKLYLERGWIIASEEPIAEAVKKDKGDS